MTRTLYTAMLIRSTRRSKHDRFPSPALPPLFGIPYGTQRFGFNFAMGPNNTFSPDVDCDIVIRFTDQASDHHRTGHRHDMPRLPQAWLTDKTAHGIRLNGRRELKQSLTAIRNGDEISLGETLYVFIQVNVRMKAIIENQDWYNEHYGPFIEVIDPTATRWCLTCLGLSSGPHVWQSGSTIMPAHSAIASAPEFQGEERGAITERGEGRVNNSRRREEGQGGDADGGREDEERVEDGGRRDDGERAEDGRRREEGQGGDADGGREDEERVEDGGRRDDGERAEDGRRREEGQGGDADGGREDEERVDDREREEGREGGNTGTGRREGVANVEPSELDRRSAQITLGKRSREEEASATNEVGVTKPQREQGVMNDGDTTGSRQETSSNPGRGTADDTVDIPRKAKKPRISNSLPTRRSARLEVKSPRYQLWERGCLSTTKSNSISANMSEKVNHLKGGKGKRKISSGGTGKGMIKKRRGIATKDPATESKSSSKRKRSPEGISRGVAKKRRSTAAKDPIPEGREGFQYSTTAFTQSLKDQKGVEVQVLIDDPLGEPRMASPNIPPITGDSYQLSSPCSIPTTSEPTATKLHPSPTTSSPRPPRLHRSTYAPPM
ncbi:hypothetical protein BJ684DRAFT_16591 [Piptocephalis cylindrospora]|uniref:FHA domain-containing protein n=1 Tax=Piptocephalis cylindrospora TaxID=1907219 RepID=A0A4P9Y261_9FUNG|nr:hypothetical protein BJ684DRAFT_16591 [Piptocephalis cylindrospora]|eukprot:RKP12966.1 hypothetical protein BJ684DRAFT_16591 [Piptocephalis cylindrospora]